MLARLHDLTLMDHIGTRWTVPLGPIVRNDHKTRLAFKDYGFPSLGRLLKSPGKITLVGTRERDSNHAYIAVIDRVGLRELKKVIASADAARSIQSPQTKIRGRRLFLVLPLRSAKDKHSTSP